MNHRSRILRDQGRKANSFGATLIICKRAEQEAIAMTAASMRALQGDAECSESVLLPLLPLPLNRHFHKFPDAIRAFHAQGFEFLSVKAGTGNTGRSSTTSRSSPA
jgi:hypothetical protein